jgi:PKD repeat protein
MKSYIKESISCIHQNNPFKSKYFLFTICLLFGFIMIGFNSAHAASSNQARVSHQTYSIEENVVSISQQTYSDYVPGGIVEMSCTISNIQSLSALGLKVLLPDGWSYIRQSLYGEDPPSNEKTLNGIVEFFWAEMPENDSVTFNYLLQSDDSVSGKQKIETSILYRIDDGGEAETSAAPILIDEVDVNGFHQIAEYIDAQTCIIENTLYYQGDLTALGIRLSLPENTSFDPVENAGYKSNFLNNNTVEIFWETPPESPLVFEYLLSRDGAIADTAAIETTLFYRVADGVEFLKNVYPDPLPIPPGDQFKIYASASEGGQIFPEGEKEVALGESITFTQTTNEGYKFAGWLVDGQIDYNAPFYQYIFRDVRENHHIQALFERIVYQITVSEGANGKVSSESGDNKVFHGDNISFIITPDEGYEIDLLRVNGEPYDLQQGNTVLFENVINNQQRLTVTFKPKQYSIIVNIEGHGKIDTQDDPNVVLHGEDKTYIIIPDDGYVVSQVKVNGNEIILTENIYTFRNVTNDGNKLYILFEPVSDHKISASASGNGKITPDGEITVEHGQNQIFYFSADANHVIKDIIVDGISLGVLDKYTFRYVTSDHTIEAKFAEKERFEIEVTAEIGGTITPGNVSVYEGEHQAFSIVPSNSYIIKDVIVDGKSQGKIETYTFWDVQEDHNIVAVFEKIDQMFAITITFGEGGSVKPSGTFNLAKGETLTIINEPNFGYAVNDIIVNTVSKGALSSYMIPSVETNYEIIISFKLIAPEPIALFEAVPMTGFAPLKVNFSNKSQGYIDSWLWTFGDGEKSKDENPGHTYSMKGQYTVSLEVSGPGGSDIKTLENVIDVQEHESVIVSFIALSTRGTAPLDVKFMNTTRGEVSSWLWDFGDGVTSTEKDPTHVYTQTGNYTVSLMADNEYSAQKNDYIKVSGRTIKGRVIEGDMNGNYPGAGLSGYTVEAHVRLASTLFPLFVTGTLTDENGMYTLTELPATTNIIVSAWPPYDDNRYIGEYYYNQTNALLANPLSTQNDNLTGIDFVLRKTPELGITGKVSQDGNGLANIEVHIFSMSTSYYNTTFTDNAGNYTFNSLLDARDYRVYIWSERLQSEMYYYSNENSVLTWELATPVIPNAPPVENINIILDKEQSNIGTIKGTVRQKDGGLPIQGLWVNAWSDTLKTGNGAVSDASGNYTIVGLLKPDNDSDAYIVDIDSADDQYPYQAYNQVDDRSLATRVMPGAEDINFNLKMGNTIFGQILDSNGNPIENVNVQTWSVSKKTNSAMTTGTSGMYSISNLPPATDYIVAAFSQDFPVQYFYYKNKKENADHVDLTKGNVYGINFRLSEGAIIEGNIFTEDENKQFQKAGAGIFVNAWSETTQRLHTEETDTNGHFKFVGLESSAEDYILYVWESDYLRSYYAEGAQNSTAYQWINATGVQPSTVQTSQDHNIYLSTGFEIRGKVTYGGVAINRVKIEAWNEENKAFDDNVSIGQFTNGFNYQLTGLPPGTYEVSFYHPQFVDKTINLEIVDADLTTNTDCELVPYARKISGIIHGLEQGEILFVKAFRKNTTYTKMIKVLGSGNDISYEITGLVPLNKYIVEIIPTLRYPYIAYEDATTVKNATLIDLSDDDALNIDLNLFTETVSISGKILFPDNAQIGDTIQIYAHSSKLNAESQTNVIFKGQTETSYEIKGLRPSDDYIVSMDSNKYKTLYYDNVTSFNLALPVDTTDNNPDDAINFQLNTGTNISGYVYGTNGKGKANVRVEAWSNKVKSFGFATTSQDGFYQIGGLEKTDDYVLYISYNNTVFYYSSAGVVSSYGRATRISTSQINPTQINFKLIITHSITGQVKDSRGRRLENINVSAKSTSTGSGNGCHTDNKGMYVITELPPGDDYEVSVTPSNDMPYIAQTKTEIKAGETNINFVLMIGYSVQGTVMDWEGNVIPEVEIEIASKDGRNQYKTTTDSDGLYEIRGIPQGRGYYLLVSAPSQSNLVDFFEKGVLIDGDFEKNITLGPATTIDGTVSIIDTSVVGGKRPAAYVMITLFSPSLESWTFTLTDIYGYYRLTNIPYANDFIVKTVSDIYVDQIEIDRSSGETIDFNLQSALIIQGTVLNGETGVGMDGALIEIYYNDQLRKIARADENGRFVTSGLETQINDVNVTEYIVVAKASGFPDAKAIWKTQQSEDLTLRMIRGEQNIIQGKVMDINENPPPANVIVFARIYKNQSRGGLIQSIQCESDGSFKFEGLSESGHFQLKFVAKNSDLGSPKLWLGEDDPAIKREGAAIITTQIDDIEFHFTELWTD